MNSLTVVELLEMLSSLYLGKLWFLKKLLHINTVMWVQSILRVHGKFDWAESMHRHIKANEERWAEIC